MPGNVIGKVFRVITWGESHGRALGAVIDGCPPLIELNESLIQEELDRRRPGRGIVGTTTRKESDRVEILSGVFEGLTTGTPISLIIWNEDAKSSSYDELREVFRPGHADITYYKKYGIRDHRGGGRSSGRETVSRVAAGAVAKCVLKRYGIDVFAFTREIAGISAKKMDLSRIYEDPYFCPDPDASEEITKLMKEVRASGDSVGGIVEIRVSGCPPGLGEPVFDKLDADLAKALMSIGAVKGVEIGRGFDVARLRGSENNDEIVPHGFLSNNAGGILGGISNGDEIICRVAVKPIPSIMKPQRTIDIHGNERELTIKGRHDACAIPRIVPVCEAMVRIVVTDHLLRQLVVRSYGRIDP